jgi:hypothetical protein
LFRADDGQTSIPSDRVAADRCVAPVFRSIGCVAWTCEAKRSSTVGIGRVSLRAVHETIKL